jgi:hypothetical protein
MGAELERLKDCLTDQTDLDFYLAFFSKSIKLVGGRIHLFSREYEKCRVHFDRPSTLLP